MSCPSCSSTSEQRTLSLCLWTSTAVETAIAQCTSRWAMARGHRLNTSIVLAAVHGLFRAVSAVEPSLFRPLPPLSPSLISHLASVEVKQNGPTICPWIRRQILLTNFEVYKSCPWVGGREPELQTLGSVYKRSMDEAGQIPRNKL